MPSTGTRKKKSTAGRKTTRKKTPSAKKRQKQAYNRELVTEITILITLAVSVLLISVDNFDFTTNFTAVLTTLNNVGPGLAKVGPVENFAAYSCFSKIVLSLDMLLGRLEILPLLMLFAPQTWRKKF